MQCELRNVKDLTLYEGSVSDLVIRPATPGRGSVQVTGEVDGIVLGKSTSFPY